VRDLSKILILLYHRLLSKEENLSKIDSEDRVYLLKEEEFSKHLEYLHSEEWSTISVEQLLESLKNKTLFPERSLIISFDDGNQTDYDLAFTLLERFGFKATFFLTSDFIDRPGHLTRSQILQMSKGGMEFGSHGKTHRFLSTLSEKELRSELVESKTVLEDLIGKDISLLSLPGGYHSSEVIEMARDAGYKAIFTSRFDWNTEETDPFELRRMSLRYSDSLSYFISLIKMDPGVYFKKRVKGSFLNLLKAVMGPNNYYRLWDLYQKSIGPQREN
jgi:peptidoglycan/xylan/chitin deacetylase (PgdA/CDA1 family)